MAELAVKPKKTAAEKIARIDAVISKVNKKFGKTIMGRIGANPEIQEKLRIKFIPTPSDVYNQATGGGFPRGRLTIVTGEKDSGKTGILLETIAYNMKKDKDFVCFWLESENSLKKEWIESFGIDTDRFGLMTLNAQDVGTEQTLDILEGAISLGDFDMVVINSMRCLVPDKEKAKKFSETTVAEQARLNAKLMRKWTPLIAEADCAFCVVQHMTTSIGAYGSPMVLAGGEAFKYWASLIVSHSKAGASATKNAPIPKDANGNPLGAMFNVKITKNHVMPESPYQYAKFSYYVVFGEGIEEIAPSIDRAVESGLIEKHGAYLWWMRDGEVVEKFASKSAFRDAMKEDPDKWETFHNELNGNGSTITCMDSDDIEEIQKEEEETQKLIDVIEEEDAS